MKTIIFNINADLSRISNVWHFVKKRVLEEKEKVRRKLKEKERIEEKKRYAKTTKIMGRMINLLHFCVHPR